MRSTSLLGMMAAAALGASTGLGDAVAVSRPKQDTFNRSMANAPRRPKQRIKRLNARVQGGNWQGMPYLSYAEHDRCVRATFGLKRRDDKNAAYQTEMERITASR